MHYKIFEETRLVKGYNRGCVYDLHRKKYDFLPNELIDILLKWDGKSISVFKKSLLQNSNKAICDEYLDFLIEKEYIFLINKKHLALFTKMNLNWELPAEIYSAVIDVDNPVIFKECQIVKQLEDLGCKHLLFRFSAANDLIGVNNFLKIYKNTGFHSFQVWIDTAQYSIENKQIQRLCENNPKIIELSLFNYLQSSDCGSLENVIFKKYEKIWRDHDSCLVAPFHFQINISLFLENLSYNNYFVNIPPTPSLSLFRKARDRKSTRLNSSH